jgi:glycosyltransferase involved in cell wall biosynthesis
MRVCHLINCLSVGGTERQLVRLVAARGKGLDAVVVTLLDRDTLAPEVEASGARLRRLRLNAARPSPLALLRLAAILREESPDLVQSWLYHANAAAALARPLAGGRWPLAWNLRQTVESPQQEGRSQRLAFHLNRWLSPRPEAVVSNSRCSLDDHRRLGFRPRREIVIPNGFDLSSIAFGPDARQEARRRLGVPRDSLVVGIIGRDHPVKDHVGFLEGFGLLRARWAGPAPLAVLIGRGLDERHPRLAAARDRLRLRDAVLLLGERLDLPMLYAGLDCLASSSILEAFPNVIGEAMIAGVPVVATDVGECAAVIGAAGRLVPPSDPESLAEALRAVLSLSLAERTALGAEGRARIADRFELHHVARLYEALWSELAGGR